MIFGEVVKQNDAWQFNALGEGTTDDSLGALMKRFNYNAHFKWNAAMPSFGRHTRRIGPVICLTATTPGFFARKIPHSLRQLRHSCRSNTTHILKIASCR
jgi:hypothetical protein